MKQFSLDEYLKNPTRPIVTRDGRSVRIVCTDRNHSTRPIIALVQNDGGEKIYSYREGGSWLDYTPSPSDLFFAPEKKSGWVNIYRTSFGNQVGEIYNSKEDAETLTKDYESYVAAYVTTIKIEWEE